MSAWGMAHTRRGSLCRLPGTPRPSIVAEPRVHLHSVFAIIPPVAAAALGPFEDADEVRVGRPELVSRPVGLVEILRDPYVVPRGT